MSTIENSKKAMGWLHQNARPTCGNCAHTQDGGRGVYCNPSLRCGLGGFYTNRFAVCDKHSPMFTTEGVPK